MDQTTKQAEKPGIKSTEFWVATTVATVGVVAATGMISAEQADTLSTAIVQVGGLVAAVAASFGYSLSRGAAKRG